MENSRTPVTSGNSSERGWMWNGKIWVFTTQVWESPSFLSERHCQWKNNCPPYPPVPHLQRDHSIIDTTRVFSATSRLNETVQMANDWYILKLKTSHVILCWEPPPINRSIIVLVALSAQDWHEWLDSLCKIITKSGMEMTVCCIRKRASSNQVQNRALLHKWMNWYACSWLTS